METIWKLCKACTLPMITYGSEADTTPGIALRTENTLADITQEINIKQINYLLKQMNRGTNEHISNSIWERKINVALMFLMLI